jgi:adenosine deaminase
VTRPTRGLPKAHLHLHLDGSYPRAAVAALARRRGVDWSVPDTFTSTTDFSTRYLEVPRLVATLDELADLCRQVVHHEADQGVVYLEPGVEPALSAHLGDADTVLATVIDAFAAAGAETGVEVGVMLGINTDHGVDVAEPIAALAVRRAGRGVVAFGTAGFGEPARLADYAPMVRVVRDAGLRIVCHAGQVGGPDSVREAIDALAPDRIAHGVQSVRDPALLAELAERGIVCDVAVTSNVRLGVAPSVEEHPIAAMLAAGVPITLNADDELWFGSGVDDEYELVRRTFGISDGDLAGIARAGTLASGMSAATARRIAEGAASWVAGADAALG